MFILAMRCIQLQKQPAAASPTTTCRLTWRYTLGNGLHNEEIFGSNDYKAVLDYQRKNNLAVDSLFLTGRWKYT